MTMFVYVIFSWYVSDQSPTPQRWHVKPDGLLPAACHHAVRRSAHRHVDVQTQETSVWTCGHR